MPSETVIPAISDMLEDVDTWALVDPLGWLASKLLQRDPEVEAVLGQWARSDNVWRKRLSVVPFIDICLKGQYRPEYAPRILRALEPRLGDEEFFVAKAVGLALRELSKHEPNLVREYIEREGCRMSRLTKREGLRKLPSW